MTKSIVFLCSAVFILFLAACGRSPTGETSSVGQQAGEMKSEAQVRLTEFFPGVGDTLKITVYRNRISENHICFGDTVHLKVYRNDDLNSSVKVGSTGQIMLPLVGLIQVTGKTVSEVRAVAAARLTKYLIDPQVMVDVDLNENLRIDDLSTTVTVDPVGRLSVPLAGEFQALGSSLLQLQQDVRKKLAEKLTEPEVTIAVIDVKSQKVLVLGEVKKPGVFTYDASMTLLEAIAKASGATSDAELSNVVLIRKSREQAEMLLYNLKETLVQGDLSPNVYLQSGDIVYVPVKTIADAGRFFKHISAILAPFVDLSRVIIFWPEVVDAINGDKTSVIIRSN